MFLYNVQSCLWCSSVYWCLCFANTYIALATDLTTNELSSLFSSAVHILLKTNDNQSSYLMFSGCPWTMYNIVISCSAPSLLLSIFFSVLMTIKGINTQGVTAQRKLHAESPDEHQSWYQLDPDEHQTELIPTWCVMFIDSSVGDSHLIFIPDPNTVGTSHEMSKKLQWAIKWPDHYYADSTTVFLPEIKGQKKTGQFFSRSKQNV